MNNGQWIVREEESGLRLDYWLGSMRRLGSNTRALDALFRGKIIVNEILQTADDAERLLQTGDRVRIWMDCQDLHTRPFIERQFDYLHIIYEDRYLLVVNKPAGLLSTPHPYRLDEESLFDHVEEYLNAKRRQPFIVHRIDRGTTGLVIFAKTLEAQEELKRQFEKREPERVYCAVTHGIPQPASGTWQNWLSWKRSRRRFVPTERDDPFAREAICHYRVIETFGAASLIEVRLVTGKRNQIRLQAQFHGHPLVGEPIYTDKASRDIGLPFDRQALHAYQLRFRHPNDHHLLSLEAPQPDDFAGLLESLRKTEVDREIRETG